MPYSIKEIYKLVGRDDRVASLTFVDGSPAHNRFGKYLVVLFLYTQAEREQLDQQLSNGQVSTGKLRAKYLGFDIGREQEDYLRNSGIASEDIAHVYFNAAPQANTFHSSDTRSLPKIELTIESMPRGGDFGWMYGFMKRQVQGGVELTPQQRQFYLAAKYFYECEELTEAEEMEIFGVEAPPDEHIEWQYLFIKHIRQETTEAEEQRIVVLFARHQMRCLKVLDKYLVEAGSSIKKLAQENVDQAAELFDRALHYKERRLNIAGAVPIYMNLASYLHIYMRHVEEFRINDHFEHKDNFQWDEDDVFTVMGKVIAAADTDIQAHFMEKPGKRFSCYGGQSRYFEGDYYTFHVDPGGLLHTFHKNRKQHGNRVVISSPSLYSCG